MADEQKLYKWLEFLPPDGPWLEDKNLETFCEAGKKLLDKGFSLEDTIEVLSDCDLAVLDELDL